MVVMRLVKVGVVASFHVEDPRLYGNRPLQRISTSLEWRVQSRAEGASQEVRVETVIFKRDE